ncbi:hypothetical protein MYXE_42890 [Mycobacterium xenopi]|uniref:Uncharacterized protein n=1 Tax=Mycobacterium xenopi TaxID=1789 RepID=A0AAD1H3I1_MYCXE|nr:hypothetical protein MYXE_42890 [Mycobacterium xenopi]
MTWRFTVAMLSEVTVAMTSRAIGPRSRTARNTAATAASDRCSDGVTTLRRERSTGLRVWE